jgi:hypothetical protein
MISYTKLFHETVEFTEEIDPNEFEIQSCLKVTVLWIKAMDQEAMRSQEISRINLE